MPVCNYCGYNNVRNILDSPRRCPICGNPYGQKPVRRLWGRFTKPGGR